MKLFKKIKILSWVFQFEFSIKKRDRTIEYRDSAQNVGWFIDLPAPGQPKLRFAKYTGQSGYMTFEFSYAPTWEELCTEQNISL